MSVVLVSRPWGGSGQGEAPGQGRWMAAETEADTVWEKQRSGAVPAIHLTSDQAGHEWHYCFTFYALFIHSHTCACAQKNTTTSGSIHKRTGTQMCEIHSKQSSKEYSLKLDWLITETWPAEKVQQRNYLKRCTHNTIKQTESIYQRRWIVSSTWVSQPGPHAFRHQGCYSDATESL